MNPDNNPIESRKITDQPETCLDECRNLAELSRNKIGQTTALIIATMGGVAVAHAAIDKPDKPQRKDAYVYSMSIEELARYKPPLHEFVADGRGATDIMVAEAGEEKNRPSDKKRRAILATAKKNGMALKNADESFRKDRDFVLAAVKQRQHQKKIRAR